MALKLKSGVEGTTVPVTPPPSAPGPEPFVPRIAPPAAPAAPTADVTPSAPQAPASPPPFVEDTVSRFLESEATQRLIEEKAQIQSAIKKLREPKALPVVPKPPESPFPSDEVSEGIESQISWPERQQRAALLDAIREQRAIELGIGDEGWLERTAKLTGHKLWHSILSRPVAWSEMPPAVRQLVPFNPFAVLGTTYEANPGFREWVDRQIAESEDEIARRSEAASFGLAVGSDVIAMIPDIYLEFMPGGAAGRALASEVGGAAFRALEKLIPGSAKPTYEAMMKRALEGGGKARLEKMAEIGETSAGVATAFMFNAVGTGRSEDALADGLIGAMIGPIKYLPDKWFLNPMLGRPIKLALEAVTFAGGNAVLKDEPLTRDAVAHTFAILAVLRLTDRFGRWTNERLADWAVEHSRSREFQEAYGPMTARQARRFFTSEVGRDALNRVMQHKPDAQLQVDLAQALHKNNRGDILEPRERVLLEGLRIDLAGQVKEQLRALPKPEDVPGERGVPTPPLEKPVITTAIMGLKGSHTTSEALLRIGESAEREGRRGLVSREDLEKALQRVQAEESHAQLLREVWEAARLADNQRVYFDDLVRMFIRRTTPLERVDSPTWADHGLRNSMTDPADPGMRFAVWRSAIFRRARLGSAIDEVLWYGPHQFRDPQRPHPRLQGEFRDVPDPLFFLRYAISANGRGVFITNIQKERGEEQVTRHRITGEEEPVELQRRLYSPEWQRRRGEENPRQMNTIELEAQLRAAQSEYEWMKARYGNAGSQGLDPWARSTPYRQQIGSPTQFIRSHNTWPDQQNLEYTTYMSNLARRISYLTDELIAAEYARLGMTGPLQFWRRAMQETVRLAAEKMVEYRRQNGPALPQGSTEPLGYLYLPAKPQTFSFIDNISGAAGREGTARMLENFSKRARTFFKGRGIEEVEIPSQMGIRHEWLKVPLFMRDLEAQYEVGGRTQTVMPARAMAQKTEDVSSDILRKLDLLSGIIPPSRQRGWRGKDVPPEALAAFKPKEFKQELLRFGAFQQFYNTLLQITASTSRYVPAVKEYEVAMLDKFIPYKTGWQHEGDLIVRRMKELKSDEMASLSESMFDNQGLPAWKPGSPKLARYNLTDRALGIREAIRTLMDRMWKEQMLNEISHIRRMIKDPEEASKAMDAAIKRYQTVAETFYVPHSRFGNYFLSIRDHTGKVKDFEGFVFERQAIARSNELKKTFPEGKGEKLQPGEFRHEVGGNRKSDIAYSGLPRHFLESLREIARMNKQSDRVKEVEKLIARSMPVSGFRLRQLKRADIAGYSTDLPRIISDYVYHASNHLARSKYMHELQDIIHKVEKQRDELNRTGRLTRTKHYDRLVNYMKRQLDYTFNPRFEMEALKSAMFHYYFIANPMAGAMNLSQIPLATYPYLAARYGDKESIGAILKASADLFRWMRTGEGLTTEEVQAIIRGRKALFLEEGIATEIANEARGGLLQRFYPGNSVSQMMGKVAHWGPIFFTAAEKANRHVTFLATYRLARRDKTNSEHDAYVLGREAVRTTQFEYSRVNRSAFARGPASPFFLFWSYFQNMINFMSKDEGSGRALAVLFGMAGLTGLPFAEDFMALADMIVTRWNPNRRFSTEEWIRDMLIQLNIDPASVLDGMFGAVGFNQKVSMGNSPAPIAEIFKALTGAGPTERRSAITSISRDAAGAAWSLPFAAIDAWTDPNPNYMRLYERVVPPATRQWMQAYRAMKEGGYTDNYNALIYPYDDPETDWMRIVGKAFGLTGRDELNERDLRWHINEKVRYYAGRQQKLLRELAFGVSRGDEELIKETMDALVKFKKEAPPGMATWDARTIRRSLEQTLEGALKKQAGIGRDTREQFLYQQLRPLYTPGTALSPPAATAPGSSLPYSD